MGDRASRAVVESWMKRGLTESRLRRLCPEGWFWSRCIGSASHAAQSPTRAAVATMEKAFAAAGRALSTGRTDAGTHNSACCRSGSKSSTSEASPDEGADPA
jgi:hypothetical protein